MDRSQVYEALDSERAYQDSLWQNNPLTPGEFLLLLEEYTALARSMWCAEPKPEQMTMDLIRKIGGIAVNALEQHGCARREGF